MSRKASRIRLTAEEERVLKQWNRFTKTEHRLVLRRRIIVMASQFIPPRRIARELSVRPATVSKWCIRFAKDGLSALEDAPRSGAGRRYDEATEKSILAMLDQERPSGHATWNGKLLAEALGGAPSITCGGYSANTASKYSAGGLDSAVRTLNLPEGGRHCWLLSGSPR